MSAQLQVTGEAKIRDIQGPVVANSGVITALDGAASQYVRGDGTLADFPTSSGGGSSVSYYLNSSVSQGTIGGVAYRELSKDPITGAGTDITISANGYVANYITDVNDPDVVLVPGGNFNCEFYFSVNNNTGNPTTYAELYKYDGTTFTLLGSSVGVPESINQGTTIAPYYFAIPVATANLALTDRLAIRIYVNVDGRTVTLHTENGHLCQVVTTLSKGMVSLNNLTDQSQFLTTGTSGTNFNIASSGDTHTFNLPVASASNTGKLSSTDWTTFNNKQNALTNPVTGTGTTNTLPKFTGTSAIGNSQIFDNGTSVGINTTSPVELMTLYKTSRPYLAFQNATTGITTNDGMYFGHASGDLDFEIRNKENAAINFFTSNVSRMTLDANGALGIGTTALTGYSLRIQKTLTGATNSRNIWIDAPIASDVTSVAAMFGTSPTTQAASFTLSNLIHYYANQSTLGAGSSVTNQYGFWADSGITGATNNFGFYGNIPSGTNRWNLFMNGTANNYLAGSLGIGTTSFVFGGGTYNLNLTKNITGTVVAGAMNIGSIVQSDVTSAAIGLNVQVTTAAAAFTLSQLRHISVNQTTLGAGSSVSNQYGVYVDQITNGSSNFGFFGNIPAGANRWNIYMDGTANNYLAGSLGIGSTSLTGYNLRISKTLTGATSTHSVMVDGGIQTDSTNYGAGFRSSISLLANATTTSLIHYLVIQGSFGAGSSATNQMGIWVDNLTGATNNYGFYGNIVAGANRWNLYMNGTANNYLAGSLGIGATNLTGVNLFLSKTLTGSIDSYHINVNGIIQSDVTNSATYFRSGVSTATASFTLATLQHYIANQGAFGAGSSVTNQYGFVVANTLIGATNNYGFFGAIPAAANRWNLYMAGTAANYLAGSLAIGSTTIPTQLTVTNADSITLDNSTHAGENIFIRSSGLGAAVNNLTSLLAFGKNDGSALRTGAAIGGIQTTADADQVGIAFYTSASTASSQTLSEAMRIMHNGRLLIGSTTDSGATLQVTGTGRFTGDVELNGASGTRTLTIQNNTSGDAVLALVAAGSNSGTITYSRSTSELVFGNSGATSALKIAANGAATFSSSVTSPVVKLSDSTLSGAGNFEFTSEAFFGARFQSNAYKFMAGNNTTEYMRITSGGNVLIGTSSGNEKFVVYNTTNDYSSAKFTNNCSTGQSYGLLVQAGTNSSDAALRVQSQSGSSYFTIRGDGNVGIGTSSPSYKLDIRNDVGASTSLDPISIGLYNGNDGGSAIYFRNSVGGQSKISFGVEASGSGTDDTYLGFSTGGNTSLTERMRITSGGNVGIGATSPTGLLNVYGGTANAPAIFTIQSSTGGGGNSGIYFRPYQIEGQANANPAQAAITAEDDNYSSSIKFLTKTTGALANSLVERMRLTASGNVLIATTTDNGQGKLQVNGAITANNISYTGEIVSSTTNFNSTYYHIISGATSSGQTFTLPSPSSNNLQYVIINKSPFSQTISAGSGFTIYNMAGSDVASITLASKARCFIIADGSGFYQIF